MINPAILVWNFTQPPNPIITFVTASFALGISSATLTYNTTGANFFYVTVATENNTVQISDTDGNVYLPLFTFSQSIGGGTIDYFKHYYVSSPTTNTSTVMHITSSSGFATTIAAAFAGVIANPFDIGPIGATAHPTTTNSISLGITPSVANTLVIGAALDDGDAAGGAWSVSNNFILIASRQIGGNNLGNAMAIQIQSGASASTTVATFSTGTNGSKFLMQSMVSIK